jgi:hypothetical protein
VFVLQPVCFRENEKPVSKDVEKAVQKNVAKGKHYWASKHNNGRNAL